MTSTKLSKEQAIAIADELVSSEKKRLKDSRVWQKEYAKLRATCWCGYRCGSFSGFGDPLGLPRWVGPQT